MTDVHRPGIRIGDYETELQKPLRALERRGAPTAFGRSMLAEIEVGPDPERTARAVRRVLEAVVESRVEIAPSDPVAAGRGFARLLGAAPFLATHIARRPMWLPRLAGDSLDRARTKSEYAERLEAHLRARAGETTEDSLREFKYYELARITWRDVDVLAIEDVGETLAELSSLAEALLTHALEVALARTAGRLGPSRWQGPGRKPVDLAMVVLGLGKLGTGELNFSSDVDLVYVYEEPPVPLSSLDSAQGARCSPVEYWSEVGRELGPLVSAYTNEGFLYRIDLELRPEGTRAPLVICEDELLRYFEVRADLWERAAYMKARPVAGDHDLGWRVLRGLDPMIFSRAMQWNVVDAIRHLKERIELERSGGNDEFDVKRDGGGIRDVEFVVQSLQLLYGGRIPQVRERSTERAIGALAGAGVLPAEVAATLLAAYRFLRRLENRIQMEGEQQRHRCPQGGEALERLARALGLRGSDPGEAGFVLAREIQDTRESVVASFPAFLGHGSQEKVLDLFARHLRAALVYAPVRQLVEGLALRFAREIDTSPSPNRALDNLERFVRGVGSRRFYYELLTDRPELVDRLTALFASSEYLSGYLARNPELVEPVFDDPDVLLLGREALEQDLSSLGGHAPEDETRLRALRLFHHRQMINVGLLDLAGAIESSEAERSLSEIAEVCLDGALALARDQIAARSLEHEERLGKTAFLVVGMGKLATLELSYGSDLDLIFLYDASQTDAPAQLEAQELSVRLAQKLIAALHTATAEGRCYEIDTRLRPSGNQGLLVTSISAFERYHAESDLWERQALLRARPIAGDPRLGERFLAARLEILRRRIPVDAAQEIHRIRIRMERELARETSARKDLKTGRGGLIDIEHVVQLLQLRHGAEHATLFEPDPLELQLGRLADLGLLDASDAERLRAGWRFLKSLSSRLRVVENRSISDLDQERGDLESLARALGYDGGPRGRSAGRELLADYHRNTEMIRDVYLRVLAVDES